MLLVLTASTANRSICTGSAAWSCLEAGAGLGQKRVSDAACAYTRPTNPRFTNPKQSFFWKAQKCSVHSANKSSPKQGLDPKRLLDAACAYTRPRNPRPKQSLFGGRGRPGLLDAACAYTRPTNLRFTAPNKKFLEAGAGLGPKMLVDAACADTRPTIPRFTAPNKAFLEAGAGLGPKRFLDAAWAYTRPTNISRPQANPVWTPGPAWALTGS